MTARPHSLLVFLALAWIGIVTEPATVSAESLDEIFLAGNDAFAHGQYPAAIEQYERVIAAGIRDADVYMNLGLAQARAGRLGQAVLAFERSLHYRPGDTDASTALAQARAAIGKRSAERQGEALVETRPPMAEALVRPFSQDSLAWLLLLCDAGLFLSLIARGRAQRETTRTGLGVAIALLGLLSGTALLALVTKRGAFQEGEAAIVLREGAELREAPDPRATTRARASEGGSARILSRDQGFARVRTSTGAVGFLSDADVALIVD